MFPTSILAVPLHRRCDNILIFILILQLNPRLSVPSRAANGKWDLLLSNIGISAMHMQLLYTDRVVIFDRTDFGKSNISLPHGKCRHDPHETVVKIDCTAHSVEYDVVTNTVRPLMVQTDVWCSAGAVTAEGTLIQTGGFKDGEYVVRKYIPCFDQSCDWKEINGGLKKHRWYPTDHILPDGRQIIIGGRAEFNYEFYPKNSPNEGSYDLPFLSETRVPEEENNLYPFVFLNSDGNLFIFANNRAILFDYKTMKVVKSYPEIPIGEPRNYPSTGSAVLLPLIENRPMEVMICGGAPIGSFIKTKKREFIGALDTCGRIRINDENPKWEIEKMPMGRTMGDMVLLPNGDVLIINGAGNGTAGWERGRSPVLSPLIYRAGNPPGSRFEVLNPTTTPRMYHSAAVLLRDGRILIGGSNPHVYYNFTGVLFPTDLTLQSFSPPYLSTQFSHLRPTLVLQKSGLQTGYNQTMSVQFRVPPQQVKRSLVAVTMYAPPFATHSFSMNQRLLILDQVGKAMRYIGNSTYEILVLTPKSTNVAPRGYYLLFVVHRDIPSGGLWIQLK